MNYKIPIVMVVALLFNAQYVIAKEDSSTQKLKQTTDVKFKGIETIVVTAQKRQQSVQQVGIAITAFSGDQIEDLGYENAQQVTAMSPGVSTIQPNGPSSFFVSIRGVGQNDFSGDHQESPVAIYIDEAYISAASGAGFQLFDLERVEILRGPQGTLFGRNATGGLVHYISKRPTSDVEGYAKLTLGRYNQLKVEGAIGGGLGESVAGRFSFLRNTHDPYVTNTIGKDLGNGDDWAVRGQLLFEFDQGDWLFIAKAGEQDIDSGFFEHSTSRVNPITGLGEVTSGGNFTQLQWQEPNDGVHTGSYNNIGYNIIETRGITSNFRWDFNHNISFTSVTDYFSLKKEYLEDSDASPADFFNFLLNSDLSQFSQDFRISGDGNSLHWVVGLYYLNIEGDFANGGQTRQYFEALGFPGTGDNGGPNGIYNPFSTKTKSSAIYGQVEYQLTDSVTLIGGARYSNEKKSQDFKSYYVEFDGTSTGIANEDTFELGGAVFDYSSATYKAATKEDGLVTAKLELDWQVDSDLMIYTSYNRGIKAGGYNAPLDITDLVDGNAVTGTVDDMSFDEEILHAFEIGFKSDFLDNTLRINGAIYTYDYKDYQAFRLEGLTQYVFNTDATVNGLELELRAQPTEDLELMLGIGYIDNNVEDAYRLPNGQLVDRVAVMTPEWNINGLARYQWELSNGGVVSAIADFSYMSEHYFQLKNAPTGKEDGYTLVNMRVNYTTLNDLWSVSAFVNNVFDQEYRQMVFDLSASPEQGGFGMSENYYGQPRWYGVSFTYRWE